MIGKTSHVVVALDDSGVAHAGLDDIGIDGTLCKEIYLANLFGLRLKDTDKLLADGFPLCFRLGKALQPCKETVGGIDTDKVHLPSAEGRFYLVTFIFPHKAGIYKDSNQVLADGL